MSAEKRRKEAGRWLAQGRADLDAAADSLKAGRYEWACFQAQQAAEKALKASWYDGNKDPWGHSVAQLLADLPDETARMRLSDLLNSAKMLDKLYIPTRYPNGLPDMIPAQAYFRDEAEAAILAAGRIVSRVAEITGL